MTDFFVGVVKPVQDNQGHAADHDNKPQDQEEDSLRVEGGEKVTI